jgi:glycerophosphoryl diester phosphodiesterase
MAEMVMINPWMIRGAHADGRKVYVWFGKFESPFMLRMMLAFGADGLIVDDHRMAARVMGR